MHVFVWCIIHCVSHRVMCVPLISTYTHTYRKKLAMLTNREVKVPIGHERRIQNSGFAKLVLSKGQSEKQQSLTTIANFLIDLNLFRIVN